MINQESEFYAKGMSESVDTRVTIECEQGILSDVLSHVEQALKACGFVFEGHLDIVPEEE